MVRILIPLLVLLSAQAYGHAILVEANPAEDARLTQAPETVRLRFDAPVGKRYLALAVLDNRHRRVDVDDAARDLLDPSIVKVDLKRPLAPGTYLVRYRVQSADGHIVTGRYRFTIIGESHATEQTAEISLLDRLVGLLSGH